MSQEDLALRIWAPSLGILVSFSEFIAGFNIYMSTLGDGAKECIRGSTEREDGVP